MYIHKKLQNGIEVFAQEIPWAESVSIGVWVGNGSRHETAAENGMSHFIEHMVFKGTSKRSATDIALEMDSIGGHLNAFTTREYTCFYAKTLSDYTDVSMDILSDMVFEPSITREDMDLERRVVFEEIAMCDDSPEDVVYDLFAKSVWGDTPMGRPILGTVETLNAITPDSMVNYMKSHYTSDSIIIAVTGKFDETLFDGLEKYFGERKIGNDKVWFEPVKYSPANACDTRDFEQIQLVVGFDSIDVFDDRAYALLVFNNIFGGGMSSRLFREIREKCGLVYSIGAGHSAYMGAGTFDIFAATTPENLGRVAELIEKEIKRVKDEPFTAEEITRAKAQLRGNYILSGESVNSQMQALGRAALLRRPIRERDEILAKIEAVDRDAIAEVTEIILNTDTLSVAVAGPVESVDGLFMGL